MIDQLPRTDPPDWLSRIDAETIRGTFPLDDILRNSLYYPAAGYDGDPVAYLAGNILSFVYIDYCVSRDELSQNLNDSGFSGYRIVAQRAINLQELGRHAGDFPLPPRGSTAAKYIDCMKEPFCEWIIFERAVGMPANHGPARFSFLYICAEGVAAFRTLYVAHRIRPAAIAIIQPGTGFGSNWTNFNDPNGPLARAVSDNPAGKPAVLLTGGAGGREFYQQPCWPEYAESLGFLGNTSIHVWRYREARTDR
jgi:hypothetical protein